MRLPAGNYLPQYQRYAYILPHDLCTNLLLLRSLDYSQMSGEGEIVKHLIQLSHWAPICPDIVATIPAQQRDIFVIDTIPGTSTDFAFGLLLSIFRFRLDCW